jgi:hypothetical protein
LSGSAIQVFALSDMIDFIDMNPATATAAYACAESDLRQNAGVHSFYIAGDGASCTKLTWS